jgi:hypothetical protein
MRAIMTNEDVGTTIDFRSAGIHQARHPWPEATVVSAGRGLVFVRNAKPGEPKSYGTLFIEVYPPGAAFIRGEGVSAEECENAAWAKYQLAVHCTDGSGTHDWEPRDYHNGAGFCSRCKTFGSKVFTGEQLGQFCATCQIGTTYHWGTDANGNLEYLCEEHVPPRPKRTLSELLSELFEDDADANPAAPAHSTDTPKEA